MNEFVGKIFFPLVKLPQNGIMIHKEAYMSFPEKNLKVDSKKRITLGKLIPDEVSSYDIELKENGAIILHPRVEIPAEEVWLYRDKNAFNSVVKGIEDAQKGNLNELSDDFFGE